MAAKSSPKQDGPLPPEVVEELTRFMEAKRSGNFVLDVKDGRVLGWRTVAARGARTGRYVS